MKLERSYNAKRNILSGVINKMILTLLPFFLRTTILYVMGKEYLGLGSLFTSILQVLSLSELGFSNAVVFSMYEPIANNDNKTLCAILNFYRKIYFSIGLVILGAGLAVMPFLPKLIKGGWPSDINLYYLYFLFLINTALSYLLFAYRGAVLNGYQRTDIISNINTVVNIVFYGLQIAGLFLTRNYYTYVYLLIACNVAINIRTLISSKKMFPDIVPEGKIDPAIRRTMLLKVRGLMLGKICATSRNAFDNIFMTAFVGLAAAGIYSNYFYILTALTGIMATIQTGILGGVGNSIVMESQRKNYDDMNRINFFYMWIGGWFAICLLCLYQPFTELVWKKDMLFPFGAAALFALYFYVLKMGDIRHVYVEANGLWWENRYRAVAEALGNLILNYVLGKHFGVYGILAATLITLFGINFLWGSTIIFKYYFTHIGCGEYYRLHAFYGAVTLLGGGVCLAVSHFLPGTLLTRFFLTGIICCIVPNVFYYLIYRHSRIYKASMPWILDVLRIPKGSAIRKIALR